MSNSDALQLLMHTTNSLLSLPLALLLTAAIDRGPFLTQATALSQLPAVLASRIWPSLTSPTTAINPWLRHQVPDTRKCRNTDPARTNTRTSMHLHSRLLLSCSLLRLPTPINPLLSPSSPIMLTRANPECTWDSRTVTCPTRATNSPIMSSLLRCALNLLSNILMPRTITADLLLLNPLRSTLLPIICYRLTVQWNSTTGHTR